VYIPNVYDLQESYTVTVKGEVNRPHSFTYRKGMTIEDVILIGGGLKESASQANVEIARRVKDPASTTYSPKIAETFTFSITADLQIAPENQRFLIEPFDEIYIRRSPGYSAQQSVAVSGEVLFGGEYVMKTTGERISDLIQRTGGLTPEAYVRGASLQRRLTADERVRLRTAIEVAMTNRGKDSLSLASVTIPEYQSVGVDIAKALAEPGCNDDLILQEGDRILIPKYNSTVRISGAVLYQNTVTYTTPKLKDYIYQGGGFKQEARRRPLVVYMNGKVAATRIKCLFFKSYPKIEPGCQIIVPMRKERTGNGLATTMGMVTSTASLAAMLAAILK
ncbi:MAG: SLBB domain-containing protein, partial [Alistipes sp.]|nr:SLBB domain-containing protein [Alistipes sp.]